jgi:DNA modification methylase
VIDIQHRDWSESLAAMRDSGGARLIVTSPPYPDARTVKQYGGAVFDTSLEGYGRFGDALFEALVPGGVCALNIDGPIRVWRPELGESERSLIAFKVAIDWAERIGFRYVERCSYSRESVPGLRGPRWKCGHEPVHVFARPGAEVYFDGDGYTLPSSRPGYRDPGGFTIGKGRRRERPAYVQGERKQLSTSIAGHVDSNLRSGHPAPFAEELALAFVLCYSQPGDLVGDPLVGSGTVAIVANKHGRRFIGGDLGHRERDGRRWADVAREACAQQPLFGAGIKPAAAP